MSSSSRRHWAVLCGVIVGLWGGPAQAKDAGVVIDPMGMRPLATATVEALPRAIAVTRDESYAYIANFNADTLSILDLASLEVIGGMDVTDGPVALAISPDNTLLWVANFYSNDVWVINIVTDTVESRIRVDDGPLDIVLSPDGTTAYAALAFSGAVSVIDEATRDVAETIYLGRYPQTLAMSQRGDRLFVGHGVTGEVEAVDLETGQSVALAQVSGNPKRLMATGGRIVVASEDATSIIVLDAQTLARVRDIPVARGPRDFAPGPSQDEVYVLSEAGRALTLCNLVDGSVMAQRLVEGRYLAVALAGRRGRMLISRASPDEVDVWGVAAAGGLVDRTPGQPASPEPERRPPPAPAPEDQLHGDSLTNAPLPAPPVVAAENLGAVKDVELATETVEPGPAPMGQPAESIQGAREPETAGVPALFQASADAAGGTGPDLAPAPGEAEPAAPPGLWARLSSPFRRGPAAQEPTTGAPTTESEPAAGEAGETAMPPDQVSEAGTGPLAASSSPSGVGVENEPASTPAELPPKEVRGDVPPPIAPQATPVHAAGPVPGPGYEEETEGSLLARVREPLTRLRAPVDRLLRRGGPEVEAVPPLPPGEAMVVVNLSGRSLSVVDLRQGGVAREVPLADQPRGVATSPDGRWIYVANAHERTVIGIPRSGAPSDRSWSLEQPPAALAVSGDGRRLCVLLPDVDQAAVLDVPSGRVATTISVGEWPHAVVVDKTGTRAYVANQHDNTVSVLDLNDGAVRATWSVGESPTALALSPDEATLLVVCAIEDTVQVLDTNTGTARSVVPVGDRPQSVALAPDGAFAYVGNFLGSSVSKVNVATGEVEATFETSQHPSGLAVGSGGEYLYVANRFANAVTVMRLPSGQVVNTLTVGAGPVSVHALTALTEP